MTDIDLTEAIKAARSVLIVDWLAEPIRLTKDEARDIMTEALPHILDQVEARVKPSRGETIAALNAPTHAPMNTHHGATGECLQCPWPVHELGPEEIADAVLALWPGKTEQEVRAEIAGISEETAMGLWWEACDDGWTVPDDLPSKYLKHVVREMNQRIARGGEGR